MLLPVLANFYAVADATKFLRDAGFEARLENFLQAHHLLTRWADRNHAQAHADQLA